jgi:hypothetical protein
MKWLTRERSQVARIADRSLIERLVDLTADFLRAPRDQVFAAAQRESATAYEQLMAKLRPRPAISPVPAPERPDVSSDKTIVFVCMNGTGMSRLAAAFFNQEAPTGWRAVSAGLAPGAALSPAAERSSRGQFGRAVPRPRSASQTRNGRSRRPIDCCEQSAHPLRDPRSRDMASAQCRGGRAFKRRDSRTGQCTRGQPPW